MYAYPVGAESPELRQPVHRASRNDSHILRRSLFSASPEEKLLPEYGWIHAVIQEVMLVVCVQDFLVAALKALRRALLVPSQPLSHRLRDRWELEAGACEIAIKSSLGCQGAVYVWTP